MSLNYKEIIESLKDDDIKILLDKLNIPYKETNQYILCPTACHNVDLEEASWKLYYYKDSHMFYCYTSCQSMSVFKFLEHYYETREIVYNWYEDVYSIIVNISNFKKDDRFTQRPHELMHDKYITKGEPELTIYSKGILDIFTHYYPREWLDDRITNEAMDKFNILFSSSRNKIIIPHFNINGELVGIRGRALNQEEIDTFGKYMPIKIEDQWYSHPLSLNLYGLNMNKDNIKNTGICYLFEAEKSVLQFENYNQSNCAVAICGSNLNIYQIKLLIKNCHPKEIVLCLDQEELKGEEKYFNKLYNICEKYKKYCNFSFIYDRQNLLNLKDSPTDKGEEVFNQLLKERVIVK